ncbi:uncharacterized protein C8A04DRAFT_28816 [Dichotomopilus funicola]|uniref:Uncharacterized protein n=1 Tax=Dichotomopilus funicola TaxID=1934379 RepID=A0AAN6ZMI6_9PEZI|nr:hypothetical protein C8A04DRAFT_28816 [Dichotomopilus funicola]
MSRFPQTAVKSQASIEASVNSLTLTLGKLSIPAETCLFSLLNETFTKITTVFNLDDPSDVLADPANLEKILNTIFDTNSVPLVTEKSVRIAAGLDDHDRSCLFIQAVAGMVLIFQRLSQAGGPVSARLLSRELQLFGESEQRRVVLDKIGHSSAFSSCYTKDSLVRFVLEAIDTGNDGQWEVLDSKPIGERMVSEESACINDRPCKNMGLPWGFTIMTLN